MRIRVRAAVWLAVVLLVAPAIPASSPGEAKAPQPEQLFWQDKPLKPPPSSVACALGPPARGTLKVLILCIEFTNVKHGAAHTPAYHEGLADGPSGSMDLFYQQASYGRISIAADSYGWFCSTQTMEHYGTPSGGDRDNPLLYQLVTEAVYAADTTVNFAPFDQNGDGMVDYLMIVHAGADEAISGNANDIWSEKYYDLDQPSVDGKRIGWYSLVSESDPMGVMAHEFGHQLGLPDLYDTDGTASGGETFGAGLWDIMAAGAYQNGGDTPSLPSAWSRLQLGWAELINLTADRNNIQLAAAVSCSTIVRVNFPGLDQEYFLVECRVRTGFDAYIPGEGLLIWHINDGAGSLDRNDLEVRPGKKRVNLEESHGGVQHLDAGRDNLGDARDPWFGNPTGFTPTSDPNTTAYLDGRHSFIAVKDISPAGAVMSCDVTFSARVYSLRLIPSTTEVRVDPGTITRYTLALDNDGSSENYSLSIQGPHQDWFTLDPPAISVGYREEREVTVLVHPPLMTPANTTSQNTIKASAASDPIQSYYVGVNTKVNPKHRSAIAPSQDLVLLSGEERRVDFTVSNLGNIPDTITLLLTGSGTSWIEYDGPASFSLNPWTNTTLQLTAAIPWGTSENARTFVQVGGRSRDGSSSASATLNLSASPSRFIMFEGPKELRVRPGVRANFNLRLTNAGTSDAELHLSTEVDSGWYANLTQASLPIPAWSSQEVTVHLTPAPDAAAGRLAGVNITASADGYANSTSIPVIVEQVFAARVAQCGTSAEVAPGVPYEYRLVLQNSGNGMDEFRFSLDENEAVEGWTWSLDAPPARLAAGESAAVILTVTAPEGAPAGMDLHQNLTVRHSSGNTTAFEIITTVARVQSISLAASQKARMGNPGESLRFELSLANIGNFPDTIALSAPKQDGLACNLSRESFDLGAGASASFQLTCRILAGAIAGLRSINLTAASRTDSSIGTALELRVTVNPVYDAELVIPEPLQRVEAGKSAVFPCTLVNRGNSNDTFTLSKVSGTVPVTFDRATLSLKAGESAPLNITVNIPDGEDGGLKELKISVRSQGKSAEVNLTRINVEVSFKEGSAAGDIATPLLALVVAVAVTAAVVVLYARSRRKDGGARGQGPGDRRSPGSHPGKDDRSPSGPGAIGGVKPAAVAKDSFPRRPVLKEPAPPPKGGKIGG